MAQQPFKTALTIRDQLSLLKARGLSVPVEDEKRMAHLLMDRGFSRLAEYWRHFEIDQATHRFIPGTTVDSIVDVYDFDATLRRFTADGLGIFEIALRSRLGYQVSVTISPYQYLDPNSYSFQTVRRNGVVVFLRDLPINMFLEEIDSLCGVRHWCAQIPISSKHSMNRGFPFDVVVRPPRALRLFVSAARQRGKLSL